MKVIKYLGFGLFFLVMGCVPDPIEVKNIPMAEERVVVSTFSRKNLGIGLLLSKNFSALTGDFLPTEDIEDQILLSEARVNLIFKKQNRQVEAQPLFKGFYVAPNQFIEVGDTVELEIDHPNYDVQFRSSTVVMPTVKFESIAVSSVLDFDDLAPKVKFRMKDDPQKKNYYMINVQKIDENFNQDIVNDPDFLLYRAINFKTFTYLFDDTETVEGQISDEFLVTFTDDYKLGEEILVLIAEIEPLYYNYLNKKKQTTRSIDFLSEPFNFPTNIENGYGFFSLHQSTAVVRTIRTID